LLVSKATNANCILQYYESIDMLLGSFSPANIISSYS